MIANTKSSNLNMSKSNSTCEIKMPALANRKRYLFYASYAMLAIILIELVLVNPSLKPVEAGKKKKIIKKIKEILPLIALLKRKKIVLLPIPM